MDSRTTTTAARPTVSDPFAEVRRENQLVDQRLNALLAANAETARQKAMYRTDREQLEADLMKSPLTIEKTFAYFGLLLGTFPPIALFIKFAQGMSDFRRESLWLIGVFSIINLLSAVVGYFSGKFIGKSVRELEKLSWTKMLLIAPFIGLVWGILAGGAGGVIVFVIGAIFGAFFGGLVGTAAMPAFITLHRLLKKGDLIEQKHFFPIAFGITFVICSFILGL